MSLLNILALVVGIIAVVVYFTGVRNNKSWGTPVFVLSALAAIILVVVEMVRVW